jgi:hypothetical protein
VFSPLHPVQINLRDAARGTVSFKDPRTGKQYALKEVRCMLPPAYYPDHQSVSQSRLPPTHLLNTPRSQPPACHPFPPRCQQGRRATMVMRPRGWHLWEHHVLVDGAPVPAPLFDFALYFWHNARALLDAGHGPYFYLVRIWAGRVLGWRWGWAGWGEGGMERVGVGSWSEQVCCGRGHRSTRFSCVLLAACGCASVLWRVTCGRRQGRRPGRLLPFHQQQ